MPDIWKFNKFEVFKTMRNNLRFINMHLGHPLFWGDLK